MGFAIAFYVTRVINFAEGQLLMVAVMVAAAVARGGVAPALACVIGVAASASIGVAHLSRGNPARARVQPLQLRVAGQHARRGAGPRERCRADLGPDVDVVPDAAARARPCTSATRR